MGKAKLLRALENGGVAERRAGESYRVWRTSNRQRRAIGELPLDVGDGLRAEGKFRLIESRADVYAWQRQRVPERIAPNRPDMSAPTQRAAPRSFLQRALDLAEDSRARDRLAEAARQFSADFELASRGPRLTMNWAQLEQGRVDGSANNGREMRSLSASGSAMRLEKLQAALPATGWDMLVSALIGETSARAESQRLCVSPAAVVAQLASVLSDVADFYDTKVRRPIR